MVIQAAKEMNEEMLVLSLLESRIDYLFFFACPKKNQKRAPENDIQHIFGIRPD